MVSPVSSDEGGARTLPTNLASVLSVETPLLLLTASAL